MIAKQKRSRAWWRWTMRTEKSRFDRNGYAPSILGDYRYCALCFRTDRPLQRHEVFHGPNRAKSKSFGLWISICDDCHRRIHADPREDRRLKEWAQRKAMDENGWDADDFRRNFGKNFL